MSNARVRELETLAQRHNAPLAFSDDLSILAKPVPVAGLTAPNALAVQPMEGCDGDALGRPGRLTMRRYERFAAGGAGLIWAEAIAVVPEGRANPRQIWLHEATREAFMEMVHRTRAAATARFGEAHRPILVAQLTHSGRYSKPEGKPAPIIPRHDPYRDKKMNLADDWPIVSDDYLDQLIPYYVNAARLAFEVGFDAVDVKSCHGYLINELLAGFTREGKYGGSFENRTRFVLDVIERIHAALGADRPVVARLGVFDAIPYPYGWGVDQMDATKPDLREPKELIKRMMDRGVPMIDVTIANPYYNPHYGRPYTAPTAGGGDSPEPPVVGVSRMIEIAGEIQRAFPKLAVVGTGYTWLGAALPHAAAASVAEGKATFAGAGRMAFAYPDFARDILEKGALDPKKICICCSGCTQIMRDGGRAGCVAHDEKVYGPIYRHGRMSNRENLLRLADRCRNCDSPSCRNGCPAGIDIPAFVRLFSEGEDRKAFDVIRRSNILPEICAWLCPVEQQCEGHCMTRFIGDGPVPIADIQRYIAHEANANGWSRLRIPEGATGKRVAVLGAGPAGLACAARLLEAGHSVTVFDKDAASGGMVASAIPSDRQRTSLKDEVAAILKGVPTDRIALKWGTPLTADFNLDALFSQGFDAVFVAFGLPAAMTSGHMEIPCLWNALDFLREAKSENRPDVSGKAVGVVGGGNTAMDVAVTAVQLGARDVYVLYRRSFDQMPAWPAERQRAVDGGAHFLVLTQQLAYTAREDGGVRVRVCPTRLGEPDASGRRRPISMTDSPYELNFDAVVEAIGQQASGDFEAVLPGVRFSHGLIAVETGAYATSRPGVFAGGDLVHGASTVVAAVTDGMRAAEEIDVWLMSKETAHVQ